MSGRRVRLSFVQFWALRTLAEVPAGDYVGRIVDGMTWPNRAPWFEAQTFRALVRKRLIEYHEPRQVRITEDGRRVLEASRCYTRSTVVL